MTTTDFIDDLASRGRYHFTTADAGKWLGVSTVATRATLRRLREKGRIAVPSRGFHVIVPPEYRVVGCLPPEQFIPELMAHLAELYYVGLLSAAELHGAAHQRPQELQVVTLTNRPILHCGKARIRFIARRNAEEMPTTAVNTARGVLRVASPEATALDLIGYSRHCGGLDCSTLHRRMATPGSLGSRSTGRTGSDPEPCPCRDFQPAEGLRGPRLARWDRPLQAPFDARRTLFRGHRSGAARRSAYRSDARRSTPCAKCWTLGWERHAGSWARGE
jgi:hypothetical protein